MTLDNTREIYDRINRTDEKMNKLLGQNEVIVEQNRELIALLKKALWYLFLLATFELGVITYGAIGKDGFNTVAPAVVRNGAEA